MDLTLGLGEEYTVNPHAVRTYDAVHDVKIVSWRTRVFARLGFSSFASTALATSRDVDRQDVEDLLRAGATHLQVAAILLP